MQDGPPHRLLRSPAAALLAGLLVVALSAFILLRPAEVERLGGLGYAGVFLSTLVASGALVLPVPYLATIVAASRSFDPTGVALVAGVAGSLGELTGYALGASGRTMIGSKTWTDRLVAWRGPRAFLAVAGLSAIPNPVFDVVGIACGVAGIPVWQFMLATLVGKTVRFWLIAAAGHAFFSRLTP